jgi:hypothetical protein
VFVGAHVLGEGTYSYSRAVDCNTGAWLEFAHGGVGKGVSLSRSVDGATLRLNWWWLLGGGQGYGYHVWSFSGEGWSESDDIGNLPDTSPADGSMIVDADGQQAIAFTTWQDMGGGDYDPVAVHIVEHDGTLVTISSEAPPEEQDSNPTPLADPQGHRYIIWRDRSAQLRYSNDLAWSDDGWIPDAVFPTLSEVYQPTAATGGGYTHLLWRDEAGHLRHNPRPNELDSILMGHDLAGCVTTGEPRDVTVCAYNTGTQAWPAGLVTATPTHQADPLAVADHSVSFIDRDVPPGDHDCVVISTVTPLDEGSQTSSWHLAVDVGDGPWPFGDPLTVNFETSIDCATGDDDDDTASGDGGDGGDGGDEGCSCSSATPRMEPRVTLGVALVIALLYRRRAHRRGNNNPVRAL